VYEIVGYRSLKGEPAMLKRMLVLIILAAIVSFNGGCTGKGKVEKGEETTQGDYTVADEGEPVDGGWIFRRLEGEPNTLNPIYVSSTYDMQVSSLLFDGTIDITIDLQPVVNKAACDSFTISDDKRVYTYYLNSQAKWHDGYPVTAGDYKFYYDVVMDPNNRAITQRSSMLEIESVETPGDYILKVTMKKAIATGIWKSSIGALPKHYFDAEREEVEAKGETYEIRNSKFNRNPIGNGPCRFVSWDSGASLVLERWEDYHGVKPHIQRWIHKIITDDNVALNALKAGEIDEMEGQPEQFINMTDGADFTERAIKRNVDTWNSGHVGWNMDGSNPFFTDIRVRKALTIAVDIDAILENVYYGLRKPAMGIFHYNHWCYDPDIERLPYDPQLAREMLEEAGWTDTNNDGIREMDGVDFRFEFVCHQSESSVEIATILRNYWEKIGVIADIRPLEWATLLQRVQSHDFEAELSGWGAGVDPDFSYNLWHSSQYATGRNYGGYNNPAVDSLFEAGRVEFDREKRAEIYREVSRIIYEDQPYIFLTFRSWLYFQSKRLKGVEICPRGPYLFSPGMNNWWIPEEHQTYGKRVS
jgi:peptide/nickel transport system substrate-binding protein